MASIEERKQKVEERKRLLERVKSAIKQSTLTTASIVSLGLPGTINAQNNFTNTIPQDHTTNSNNLSINQNRNTNKPIADFMAEQINLYQDEMSQKIIQQKSMPIEVDYQNREFVEQYYASHVGNLNLETCRYQNSQSKTSKMKVQKRPDIITINQDHPMFNENFLAYFSPNNPNSIVLQKMTPLSEELAQTYKDKGLNYVAEYRKGNPVALNLAALHEWGHQQAIVNSNPKDNLQYFSDFYRNDRLNEKRSKAIEYLYIANQYSQLKAQGVETVEYGGKKYPTESILDICPEIKNYLTENNFSIDDKKQVRDIVKIASDTWNTKHAKTYSYQLFTNAEVNMAADNIFQTLHQDEHAYNKVANDMLKKVHVGFNTNLDLRYCRDLLDDCTHEDVLIAVKDKKLNYVSTTFDEIIKIDNYLSSIGIADKNKAQFLEENYKNITTRQGPVDEGLKNLLLASDNATIKYADGIIETKDGSLSMNGVTVSSDKQTAQKEANAQTNTALQSFINSAHMIKR